MTWSSPVMPHLKDPRDTPFSHALTSDEASWISSLLPVGAIFGPFVYGYLADAIGRKLTLLVCGVPFLLGFITFALMKMPWAYYVARFIIGMSVGGVFTVMPMYIGEVSEASNRGMLGASMNCFMCFGFFFSHAVGSYLDVFTFDLILAAFPVAFLLLFAVIADESPHYYVIRQRDDKAKVALRRIRQGEEEEIDRELLEMQEKAKEAATTRYIDIFRTKGFLKAFSICVGLLAFQQFSGINAVLFYVEDIFHLANPSIHPKICSITVGTTQFLTSFSTPLFVDRVGRKLLLVISSAGIIISDVPLGIYCYLDKLGYEVGHAGYIPVMCLIGYIIAFNIGLAILPWSIMGELFPDSVKFKASSAATAITWFVGFLIASSFQPVSNKIGIGITFFIFAGFCVLSIPFTILFVIETRGKSLQEIQEILN